MKLFYSPNACSLAPHIVTRELDIPVKLVRLDAKTHLTEDGADYYKLNPKGSVPALQFDNGEVLTEAAVILQYLADQKPEAGLAPKLGTMERYRLQEWLNFIATDLHKQMSPLFNPKLNDEMRAVMKDRLGQRLTFAATRLETQPYLMGEFSVADAYLFTVLRWTKRIEFDLTPFPSIGQFIERMNARPAVKAAIASENPL